VKAAGTKLICFAPVLSLAKRLIKAGVDALVIEGNEAGGTSAPCPRRSWRRSSS